MSYPISLTFYTTAGLNDLRAQIYDSTGTNSGAAISTGFIERGTNGMYNWFGVADDGFVGGVEVYSLADALNILGIRDINPREIENSDVKASTLATQTSVNTIDDLLDTEIAAIQSALTSLATKVAAIRAGVVGRSVADDANDPTEIEYYDEDDTTVLFTHTLTDTERTVA